MAKIEPIKARVDVEAKANIKNLLDESECTKLTAFTRNPLHEDTLQFFSSDGLKPELQDIAKAFSDLANMLVETLEISSERTKCFDSLLNAREAALRAALFEFKDLYIPVENEED